MRQPPLYALFAAAPVILDTTYANRKMVYPSIALSPLAVAGLVSAAMVGALYLVTRDLRKAGAITALLVAMLAGSGEIDPGWLPWAWLAVGAGVVFLAVNRRGWEPITVAANTFVAFLVAWSAVGLLSWSLRDQRPEPAPGWRDLEVTPARTTDLPDLYLVVVDGYGRADVLDAIYAYDDPLPDALRERGFFVAAGARSNYAQTGLSIASVLNLDYLSALLADPDLHAYDRMALKQLIEHNRAVDLAHVAGYQVLAIPGEYSLSWIEDADRVDLPGVYATEYATALVNNTALPSLLALLGQPPGRLQHALRRHHLQFQLDRLAADPGVRGPAFVFAHLVAPHPPFVFRADGSYRPSAAEMSTADGSAWQVMHRRHDDPYGEVYQEGYADQVAWFGARLTEVVDAILERTGGNAAIVILSDHGPGARLEWSSPSKTDVKERMSILAAIHLPGGDRVAFDDDLTSVNALRLVFDAVLGTDFGRLPDRVYFSRWTRPYDLVDVTRSSRGTPARKR